jgi:hypothetical protein
MKPSAANIERQRLRLIRVCQADGLDVRFGATAFQDYAGVFPTAFGYPATAYGPAGSYPHVRVQPLTADTAAVANAIYNAIGVRLGAIPFTPDKVLAALGKIPVEAGE